METRLLIYLTNILTGKTDFKYFVLPSTSPANASISWEKVGSMEEEYLMVL
ncbi:MAG: hypothetical protein IPH33_13800 [Bacteroidetes bacterium]|nr:hypothetical protein [Bacteroidota bacterium]